MAETAFPADQRGPRENPRKRGRLEPPGFECAGPVALDPEPAPADGGDQRRQTRGKTGASGEMKHLIVQALGGNRQPTPIAREHGERRAVAQPDRARGPHRVGRGPIRVEDFQGVKSAGDKRAQEIKRKHQRPLRQPGPNQACGLHEPEVRRDASVRKDRHVVAPAEFAPQPVDADERRAIGQVGGVSAAPVCIKTADAKIAAGHENGMPRIAPRGWRRRPEQRAHRVHPGRRRGFVQFPAGQQRQRHPIATLAAQHWARLQRPLAPQQRGECGRRVAERRKAGACRQLHRIGKIAGHA